MLRSCGDAARQQRLRKRRIVGQSAKGQQRRRSSAPARRIPVQLEPEVSKPPSSVSAIDIDDACGRLDVQFHQVVKGRAAGQKTRSGTAGRDRSNRLVSRCWFYVGERSIVQALRIFRAASWMAATMPA